MGLGCNVILGAAVVGMVCADAAAQFVRQGPVTAVSPVVSTLTTGTLLDVSASVSADSRYLTLNTHVSQSSLDGIDAFGGAAGPGQPFLIDVRGKAVGVGKIPYRPAEVQNVTVVERDRALALRPVVGVAAENLTWRAAVRRISAASGANIAVGWKAFTEAGIDDKALYAIHIADGTLKDALLELARQAAPRQSLVISFDENVAFITTQAQADTMVESRWYYTADLLANAPRWLPAQSDLGKVVVRAAAAPRARRPALRPLAPVEPEALPSSLFAPGTYSVRMMGDSSYNAEPYSMGAAGAAAEPQAVRVPPPQTSPSTDIAALISSSVRPEIWKCNGGKVGEIHEVRDRVLVTAPVSVHALLEGPRHTNPNQVPRYLEYGR